MQPAGSSILMLGSFLSHTTGYRNVCEEMADRFEAEGWKVFRASTHETPIRKLADMLGAVWRHRASYTIAHLDVFSGQAFVWAYACSIGLQILGKPFVATLHGGNLPDFGRRHPRWMTRFLGRAARVTAPSPYLREQMRGYRDDISDIPNPIDISRYRYRARASAAPNIIWVRSIHRIYDPILAVDACAALRSEFPSLRLWMLGPDKSDGTLQLLRERIERHGMRDQVEIVGGVPKETIPEWLDRADVFLNTTTIDNTPVSVIEAMASGLCIVSTDVGGIPYLLRDGENAILVSQGDPETMAGAIRRILRDPQLAAALSQSARAASLASDWARVREAWAELFAAVLRARR
jgi:glycosyltransferase involved in cell wall biosynthesis